MSYRSFLVECGISDSRLWDLECSISSLHSSLCKLDDRNLALIEQIHPGISEIADIYARKQEGGLRRFHGTETE